MVVRTGNLSHVTSADFLATDNQRNVNLLRLEVLKGDFKLGALRSPWCVGKNWLVLWERNVD